MTTARVRHRCFISYHHDDQAYVDAFVSTFDKERRVFAARALGAGMDRDIIDSANTDYVMRRIRELYLRDSTVTIVLLGRCTQARRYVDWELQSSLRHGETVRANGLLGIRLPSYRKGDGYPNRLNLNLGGEDGLAACYARVIDYPTRSDALWRHIDDAFNARWSRSHLIDNPRDRFVRNRQCG